MKRIALQLLLSIALILQGAYAFGSAPAQPACCCHGGQAAHTHCGHGTPCQSDCACHCLGCATSVFIAVPAFVAIASYISAGVTPRTRSSAQPRDDLPPTRPPII